MVWFFMIKILNGVQMNLSLKTMHSSLAIKGFMDNGVVLT